MPWTTEEAIKLCIAIESIAPKYGAHVALTGGTLYKLGPRKDVDIVLYRIRQVEYIDITGLLGALGEIGISMVRDHGWVVKALYDDGSDGKSIDFFFPEREGLEYH